MSDSGQEIEVKFYIRDLNKIKRRLGDLDAKPVQDRVLETNLRFDLPDAGLRAGGRVLRLRRDTAVRLTYKGASTNREGILSREEIEFVVEDFERAKRFLQALGYQKLFYYEKYRTTYQLNEVLILLDELPYGDFIEIEGQSHDAIQTLADRLGLQWSAAVGTSYHALFERVRGAMQLQLEELSFANFVGIAVTEEALGVRAADR